MYKRQLEDYVDVNPAINRTQLNDSSVVSFVPMPAVSEKTNQVVYEQRNYKDVKTGFTPFQCGDLLWAKITPCMQNGKSFLADSMPTEYEMCIRDSSRKHRHDRQHRRAAPG